MSDRKSRKHASGPGTALGSTSRFTYAERERAVIRAEELMHEGRSVTQASREVGAESGVSHRTVQRWADALDRPLSQNIQESLLARAGGADVARSVRRQFTGADYRRLATTLTAWLERGVEELEERLAIKRKLDTDDHMVFARVQQGLSRALLQERALIELGFGLEPDHDHGDQMPNNMIDWEAEAEEVRRIRREQDAAEED